MENSAAQVKARILARRRERASPSQGCLHIRHVAFESTSIIYGERPTEKLRNNFNGKHIVFSVRTRMLIYVHMYLSLLLKIFSGSEFFYHKANDSQLVDLAL